MDKAVGRIDDVSQGRRRWNRTVIVAYDQVHNVPWPVSVT
jgi:hypothetical protein